ncbi:hypothetical protein [Haloferula sp.]|uniref:hypothetical protein n=1 Tax=Haloferula sp. TaxID=2497595 RepID=UPI003C75039B
MKKEFVVSLLLMSLVAAVHSAPKRSLLDDDPEVIYLEEHVEKPIELLVIKAAQVFSDKEGKRPLGNLVKDQKVLLQAMTDRAYRVSAQTGGNKVTGWVAPWAFASKDPNFVENLKSLYERQMEVAKLVEENRAAIGMTLEEAGRALGSPNKTKVRQTAKGRSGSWEFVDYEEIRHYTYVRDPVTGRTFRQFSHVTQEEKGKTVIEFEDDVVTAIEQTETDEGAGRVKIVIPPVVFAW